MRVNIVTSLPDKHKTDVYCCFFEAGQAWHHAATCPTTPPVADVATGLAVLRGAVLLQVNLSALKHYTLDDTRRIAGALPLMHAGKTGGKTLTWFLDGALPGHAFRQLAMGLLLADYRFNEYKNTNGKPRSEKTLTIVAGTNAAVFRKELKRLELLNGGISVARDLANLPGNHLAPLDLAARAKSMCAKHGLRYEQLGLKEITANRYAGLIGVGQGSANPPVLFSMTYKPAKAKAGVKPLCFVGKGITFDSGGLSIKPSEGMWDMKADMGGAAAVIGLMQAIAELQLPIPVIGVVAAAENMPDGKAYRPGDILTFSNGRTVEIHSTDAEGRLVLADALLHAQRKLKQRRIIELSTLTGACVRALGNQYSGLLSRSAELSAVISQAAELSGEPIWQLPLHPEYRRMLDSSCADIKNVGGALAGASTAGMFLYEFIDPGTEYAHLDIAGTFLSDKEQKFWGQAGATGTGVRLCTVLTELECGVKEPGA
jgi:leucyl aminopeptidase